MDTSSRVPGLPETSSSEKGPLQVLLVEDNPGDARLFEEHLREGPVAAQLRHEETLGAGLEALREERPDVLALDLGLPGSEGAETVRAVAAADPEVPIVVLTGQGDLQVALQAQEAGATEYLQKEELGPALVGRTLRWAVRQRRMQAKLRQRDAWIRSITEGLSAGVFRAGPTGRIEYANEALAEMLGAEAEEELVGRDLTGFYADPTDRGRMLAEEGAREVEIEFEGLDGSELVGLFSARAVYDERGRPVHYDGTVTDITGRKKKARRLEAVFDHTYQFTGLMQLDGTMIEANDTALQFGNVKREEVVGKPLWETRWAQTGPESKRKLKKAIRRAAEGEFVRYERPVLGEKETRITDFSIRPVRDEKGEVELLVPEARDITELKRREQKLQARRQKIEALYGATSGLLRIEDSDSAPDRILAVLREVFDFPFGHVGLVEDGILVPKETVAKDLSSMPEPKAQPIEKDLVVTRAMRAGEVVVVDFVEDLANSLDYGTLSTLAGIPIGERGAVVVGKEDGGFDAFNLRLLEVLASYAALVLDRLEREETLLEARKEAEEAAQLKSAMLANMSHEVRTPLMSMIGSADLLREDLEGKPAEMVEQIFQSGQRLRKTLDSVLQLSRLESGTYELDDDPANLDVIVREVAQELNLRAHQEGVQLEVETGEQSVEAQLDETATRRIVSNLVENAIKFTPEGGSVQVRARSESRETALLEVEDTGVGIAEEAKSKLFDAFKQESEGLGREYEGSGLGLSIVRRLTNLMDGTIEVESEKGVGTRFAVRFPR